MNDLAGHGRIVCSCGALIAQCRCFSHGKVEQVITNGCQTCNAAVNKSMNDVMIGKANVSAT